MNLVVAWNELAERPLAPNPAAARERMNRLVDTLAKLRTGVGRLGPRPTLRCAEDFYNRDLATDYTVARWQSDTDRDRLKLFRLFATASPFLLKSSEGGDVREQYVSEATCGGDRAEGLHSAWLWNGIAVSLASDGRWDATSIAIEVATMDDAGALSSVAERVRHASSPAHVSAHDPWFEEQARLSVADASDLWSRRDALFPNLEFCGQVEAKLRTFDAGSPQFRQIMVKLFALDRAFRDWDRTPIHPDFGPGLCTPETPQTLKDERDDHTATRTTGEEVLFSWHLRFTPDAGRIFFAGDPALGRGIIGYIGRKKDGRLT